MNSKNAFTILLINTILIGFSSCKESKSVIEKIDFASEYKFDSEIEGKVAKDTVPWKYQISASDYATKGDYKNALIHWDLAYKAQKTKTYSPIQIDSINKIYRIEPAIEYISEQSKSNQIVIINEAHHNSSHRFFTKSLLQKLYNNGYRNLGLEALENGKNIDSLLMDRKYPIQKTGFYIKAPQFGDLVRTAIQIGYNVFPYEQTTNLNGKDREIEQAKNIQKVIENKPNEKFIIHCGFSHALEGEYPRWEKTMSGRILEYTGINPLTINQTFYSERSKPEFNNSFLRALDLKESSVLINKDEQPYRYERAETWSDIAVFHPNTQYIDSRPNWLFKNGNENVSIILDDIEIAFPIMVLAFKKGEDINTAIPIDITELENKTDDCNLGLKKGHYVIVITNGKESIKFEQRIK